MFRKIDHMTIYALLLTIASILVLYYIHVHKADSLEQERKAMVNKAVAKELSFTLAMASDHLTDEVRKFAITLNPKHLRNYWRELNVIKRREKVLKKLRDIGTPKEEFELLNQAKNNSDALVNTETLAQRLILEVYEVPESQMEPQVRDYQLTQEDRELDFNQKVNKARELLFNEQYDKDKELIMAPIRKFQETIDKRIDNEIEIAKESTDRYSLLSTIWMALLTFLIFVFVYNVIQRIATPIKDLEAQMKTVPSQVNVPEKSVAAIHHITAGINRILRTKVDESV